MSVDFQEIGFGFGSVTGRTQELRYEHDFKRKVSKATVALKGFSAKFDNSDHELHLLQVSPSIESIVNTKVVVKVKFLLRDNSGNIDDKYSGGIVVIILADLESSIRPPIFLKVKTKNPSKTSKKITKTKN